MEEAIPFITILLFAAVIVFGAVVLGLAVYVNRKSGARLETIPEEQRGKYPEGRWMGIGMCLGVALGLPMGLAMDNIAVGPAFGLCIGVAIGATLERKHKAEMRPLTADEKRIRSRITAVGLVLVALVAACVAVLLAAMPK
jgi:uncharacterized membrane protein YfcA